jgi:hypothetical protein
MKIQNIPNKRNGSSFYQGAMKIQNIPNKRNGSSSPIQPQSYYKIDLADSRNRSPHRIAKKKAQDILLSFDTSISPKECWIIMNHAIQDKHKKEYSRI